MYIYMNMEIHVYSILAKKEQEDMYVCMCMKCQFVIKCVQYRNTRTVFACHLLVKYMYIHVVAQLTIIYDKTQLGLCMCKCCAGYTLKNMFICTVHVRRHLHDVVCMGHMCVFCRNYIIHILSNSYLYNVHVHV